MPDVPPPEDLPSEAQIKANHPAEHARSGARYYGRERPIELRPVEYERYLGKKIAGGAFNVWIKATGKLPTIRRSTNASSPMRPT